MITDEMTYVNLRLNPERYTGYIGPSARRIWEAIYSENCPKRKLRHSKVFLVFSISFFILLFSNWLINSCGCLNPCNYTGFCRYIWRIVPRREDLVQIGLWSSLIYFSSYRFRLFTWWSYKLGKICHTNLTYPRYIFLEQN